MVRALMPVLLSVAPAAPTLNELYVFCDTPEKAGAILTVCRPFAAVETDVAVPPSGTMPAANAAAGNAESRKAKHRQARKPPLLVRRPRYRFFIRIYPAPGALRALNWSCLFGRMPMHARFVMTFSTTAGDSLGRYLGNFLSDCFQCSKFKHLPTKNR